MLGEIIIGLLVVLVIVIAIYMVTRADPIVRADQLPPVTKHIPMPPVKPTRKEPANPWPIPSREAHSVKERAQASRVQYSSGSSNSFTHVDNTPDLLTTMVVLDMLDTSDNYVEPSVDTYSQPSYSSPTPSSYSSYDDSSSRYSSYSDSSSYSSSSSDSSSSSSDSSSSSSSSD